MGSPGLPGKPGVKGIFDYIEESAAFRVIKPALALALPHFFVFLSTVTSNGTWLMK